MWSRRFYYNRCKTDISDTCLHAHTVFSAEKTKKPPGSHFLGTVNGGDLQDHSVHPVVDLRGTASQKSKVHVKMTVDVRDVGWLTELVHGNPADLPSEDVCILPTCTSFLHFFGKTFAHRDCPKFSIFGIKVHRWAEFLFLTNLKKICSLESYILSKLGNIGFGEQSWVQFL